MTHPTPSSSTPGALAPSRMQPTRWVLTGSPLWCAGLRQQLDAAAATAPMLRWRLDAGLVTLVPLETGVAGDPLAPLGDAIADALSQRTTLLRLLAEPQAEAAATAVLARRLDLAPGVQGAAGAAQAPFAALLQALAMPEAQALARWLAGPRHRRPLQVHQLDGDSPLHRQADAALADWLDSWLDGATNDDLEAVYGPADTRVLTDQGADAGAPVPARLAQPLPVARRPVLMAAAAAAAAGGLQGAAASGTLGMPLSGRVTGPLGRHGQWPVAAAAGVAGAGVAGADGLPPADRYSLQWPLAPDTGWPVPAQRAKVHLQLDLDAAHWHGHAPRLLVLHPANRPLPVLVPLEVDVAAGGRPPARGRWVLQATAEMDRADVVGCSLPDAQVDLLGAAVPAPAR